jgi:hypothetical protein
MVNFPYPSENLSGMFGLIQYVNILTEGWFGAGILILISVIILITTSKDGNFSGSLAFASFSSFLLSLIMLPMGIISDNIFYIVITALVCSMILVYLNKENSQP